MLPIRSLLAGFLMFPSMACPQMAMAAPDFPLARNAVGPDETHLLDTFGEWKVHCVRAADNQDSCKTSTTISSLENGLELNLTVTPVLRQSTKVNADVDLLAFASIVISPYSKSNHYNKFTAAITKTDATPFDGYWCGWKGEGCSRGPDLDFAGNAALLSAKNITVSVYDVAPQIAADVLAISSHFVLNPIVDIDVPMSGFSQAYERAKEFTADTHGIDLLGLNPEIRECGFDFKGNQKAVTYTYDEDFEAKNITFREALRGARGSGDCPSYVMLASLTPDMTAAQRSMFCLDYDKDQKTYAGIQLGVSDAYGVCKAPSKSFCERVNSSKQASLAIAGFVGSSVGGAVGATTVTGTTVVAHSSGAAILTGSGGYIAGTLGTIGTSVLGIVTAPATIAAGAVTVVAVGGAVYVCS